MPRNTHDRTRDHSGTELADVVVLSADELPYHAGDSLQSVVAGLSAVISANEFAFITLHEGTTPASPVSGDDALFIDSADHQLKFVDHSGSIHSAFGIFSSPMTTEGDIIYQHSGSADRLPVGAVNTVLHGGTDPAYSPVVEGDLALTNVTTFNVSITKHGFVPTAPNDAAQFLNGLGTWATPSGYDPMTTKGDIILGDSGGSPVRLGAGTAGYVLTSNGAAAFPSWQVASVGNVVNPMTTLDDIIIGGASGLPSRLPKGTDGQVLTVDPTSHHVIWSAVVLTNPMTTQDDIIIAGVSGAPARLAKGSDSFILTIDPSTHHVVWAAAPVGFVNPMTTAGDLILGTTAGAPIRLAKGSDSQVLTVDPTTHLPLWAAIPAGFVNPMTTQDDIILGGAAGVPARLAKGSDGQVLTVDPTTHHLIWSTPSAGSVPVTTKGDLFGYSTAAARVPIGGDTSVLTADSTQPLGLKWAPVSGGAGGGLVLLEQHTASASASLDFVGGLSSSYDEYMVEIVNLVPTLNGVYLSLRCSTNGGSTYDTTVGNYDWEAIRPGFTGVGTATGTSIPVVVSSGARLDSTSLPSPAGTAYTSDSEIILDGGGGIIQDKTSAGVYAVVDGALMMIANNGGSLTGSFRLFDPVSAAPTTISGQTHFVLAAVAVASNPVGTSGVFSQIFSALTPDGAHLYVPAATTPVGTVSVFNTSDGTHVSVTVGSSPRGVAITPDGAHVYVSNMGTSGTPGTTVSVIATSSNTVVATVTVDSGPYYVLVSPDGAFVYVSCTTHVDIIRTSDNTVVANILVPSSGSTYKATAPPMVITPDGSQLYVLTLTTALLVIQTGSHSTSSVTVATSPQSIAISPDGASVYVGGSTAVSVIATSSNTVVATVTGLSTVGSLVVSSDNAHVYAMNAGGGTGTVSVIRTSDNTVVANTLVTHSPQVIGVTPDGSQLHVLGQSSVSIIRTSDYTLMANVPFLGSGGGGSIAFSSDSLHAYVTNTAGSSVATMTFLSLAPSHDRHITAVLSGTYLPASAVNALRFALSSGTIASGTIRLYGVAKS